MHPLSAYLYVCMYVCMCPHMSHACTAAAPRPGIYESCRPILNAVLWLWSRHFKMIEAGLKFRIHCSMHFTFMACSVCHIDSSLVGLTVQSEALRILLSPFPPPSLLHLRRVWPIATVCCSGDTLCILHRWLYPSGLGLYRFPYYCFARCSRTKSI